MTTDQNTILIDENLRLRKAVDELSVLNDLARVISSAMTLDAVIENVVKKSVKAVRGQQGMITLVDEEVPTEMKTLIRTQNSTSDHQQFHLNQNILGWMMINKKPMMTNDLSSDPRFTGVWTDGEIRSILCVPLLAKNKLIGILAVFNKSEGNGFTEDDKRLLSILATQSAQVLETTRLYQQEQSLKVIQEQVRLAAVIQNDLLPKKFPTISGYEIVGKSIPAQQVGGDYFDFIPLNKTEMAICVGDVSGKGFPASLLMANLQATLRGQSMVTTSPKQCINHSNKLLFESTSSEKFATLFYGILDWEEHKFQFCNAGQDPPLHISHIGDQKRLSTGGIVLGIMDSFPYEEEAIPLSPNDMIVIYTDGVTEAMNSRQEMFGEENLTSLLMQHHDLTATEVMDTITAKLKAHIGDHTQYDDITIVVIKRKL
ncbi:MAG: SpoIIE family protein phosphatase [Ignavibacteriales bacterium]|nr:SpoIIE family protein phosphatase [Ignavibacteriales bacterium]